MSNDNLEKLELLQTLLKSKGFNSASVTFDEDGFVEVIYNDGLNGFYSDYEHAVRAINRQ
jgi:hypothetical protein